MDSDKVGNEGRTGKKLNFNAPLLSTRRPGASATPKGSDENARGLSRDASKRVPFLWERAPGMPKDIDTRESHVEYLPPPKLPPGRWRLPQKEANGDDSTCEYKNSTNSAGDDDDDDAFSDAIDMFSLSESIEIADGGGTTHGLNGLDLEKVMESSGGDQSPNFIIRRFLPAANALAAEAAAATSTSTVPKKSAERALSSLFRSECEGRAVGRSSSPPKACGLDLLLPWRARHTLCGLKSPVRQRRGSSSNVKPQRNARQKPNSSSAEGPSRIGGVDK